MARSIDQIANVRLDEIAEELEILQSNLSDDGFDAYTDIIQEILYKITGIKTLLDNSYIGK